MNLFAKKSILAASVCMLSTALASAAPVANPLPISNQLWFDNGTSTAVTVQGTNFVDGYGRQVTLRGFNVSAESKLDENHLLPFASTTDARNSAIAMKRLTGANSIRFLITWAGVEPTPGYIDQAYLQKVTDQIRQFINQGILVYIDFHQDIFSRYIFNQNSWYTGDGAPSWIVAAGAYPVENCGICITWALNETQNPPVLSAFSDFWHNRSLATSIGSIGMQDEFLKAAGQALSYIKYKLTPAEFNAIVGVDPFNEPMPGQLASGQSVNDWEIGLLWPFYQRFRATMDSSGWYAKPAMIEPNPRWVGNIDSEVYPGGLQVGVLGSRYVFNAHYYDWKAQSGILMPFGAQDGWETAYLNSIRTRASQTASPALVSEFGFPNTGLGSGNINSVYKSIYQSLDSAVPGGNWWATANQSGQPLSATQWHWDIYSGRHHEYMNGNPSKLEVAGDAWNGEDFSAVVLGPNGNYVLTQDAKLFDRIYPRAVAGTVLAFAYEDRANNATWNPIPSSMPNLQKLVGGGQYGVLLWRGNGSQVPTELHLPLSFSPTGTTVISDLGVSTSLPGYSATTSIAVAKETGDGNSNRLILTAPTAGATYALHYALVAQAANPDPSTVAAAQRELSTWASTTFK
jgi:hypothetical protein